MIHCGVRKWLLIFWMIYLWKTKAGLCFEENVLKERENRRGCLVWKHIPEDKTVHFYFNQHILKRVDYARWQSLGKFVLNIICFVIY